MSDYKDYQRALGQKFGRSFSKSQSETVMMAPEDVQQRILETESNNEVRRIIREEKRRQDLAREQDIKESRKEQPLSWEKVFDSREREPTPQFERATVTETEDRTEIKNDDPGGGGGGGGSATVNATVRVCHNGIGYYLNVASDSKGLYATTNGEDYPLTVFEEP